MQASGNAVQICDATTGHSVTNVAFCDSPYRAATIVLACKAHDDLVDAVKALKSIIESAITSDDEPRRPTIRTCRDTSIYVVDSLRKADAALAKAGVV